MPFETHIKLLANGDWLEMLLPLLLLLVYGAAAMVKRFLEYSKQKSDESQVSASDSTSAGGQRRYRPIEPSPRPQMEGSQTRTLPYARTAAQRSTPVAEPRRGQQRTDWQRQQEAEQRRQREAQQRRLAQIEAQRLKHAQQNQQMQRQQQVQNQAAKSVEAARIAAQRTAALPSRAAVKSPKEALQRARTGGSSGTAARVAPKKPAAARPKDVGVSTSSALREMLAKPQSLRTAVVLKELLDQPLGLRDR